MCLFWLNDWGIALSFSSNICWGLFQGRQKGLVTIVRPWPPPQLRLTPRSNLYNLATPCLPGLLGSGHHELPVVIPTARGDLVFSCTLKGVPHLCASSFLYPTTLFEYMPFQAFFYLLFMEEQGTQSRVKNVIECQQRPLDYYWETRKTHLVLPVSYP